MAADGNKINKIKDEPSDSRITGCGQTELTTSKGKEERMSRLPLLRDQHAHQAATTPRKNGRLIAAVWCSARPPVGPAKTPCTFRQTEEKRNNGEKKGAVAGAGWGGGGEEAPSVRSQHVHKADYSTGLSTGSRVVAAWDVGKLGK